MFSIGKVAVDCPLILAPMAGISDLPFRLINRSFGCGLAFTEMISATSIANGSRQALRMLSTSPDDRPLGVQILGGGEDIIKRTLDSLSAYAFDMIDFNAACPVSKVVSKGKGAGLLREPLKLQKLLKVIVENTSTPVTVKMRSGWDKDSVNAVDLALRAEDAGVDAIFIHGRTRQQGYRGTVDYDIIREVKRSVGIPVIASGDALSPVLISKLFDSTGCDAVAVARGALGNPWIFRRALEHLNGVTEPAGPDVPEIRLTMKRHLDSSIAFHGESTAVMRFRKFFGWYTKGLAVKELKVKAFRAQTRQEMSLLIDRIEASLPVCSGSGRVAGTVPKAAV